jgi:hypothetical protein
MASFSGLVYFSPPTLNLSVYAHDHLDGELLGLVSFSSQACKSVRLARDHLDGELLRAGVFLTDEVLRARLEVVKHVLLVAQRPGRAPLYAILASAPAASPSLNQWDTVCPVRHAEQGIWTLFYDQ